MTCGYFMLLLVGLFALLFSVFWHKFVLLGSSSSDAALVESLAELPTAAEVPMPNKTNPFNMKNLIFLPVSPPLVSYNSKIAEPFNFTLSDDFLIGGDPYLTSIEAWYDKVNLKSIRFTFSNGQNSTETPIFGVNRTRTLSNYQTIKKTLPNKTEVIGSNSIYLNSGAALSEVGGSTFCII
jgi:hypothetical protein